MRLYVKCAAAGVLLSSICLTGCKQEPDFEERYERAQNAINAKAVELEKDMASRAAQNAPAEPPVASSAPAEGRL